MCNRAGEPQEIDRGFIAETSKRYGFSEDEVFRLLDLNNGNQARTTKLCDFARDMNIDVFYLSIFCDQLDQISPLGATRPR